MQYTILVKYHSITSTQHGKVVTKQAVLHVEQSAVFVKHNWPSVSSV